MRNASQKGEWLKWQLSNNMAIKSVCEREGGGRNEVRYMLNCTLLLICHSTWLVVCKNWRALIQADYSNLHRVKHSQDSSESDSNGDHRLHFDHAQISAISLELFLLFIKLLLGWVQLCLSYQLLLSFHYRQGEKKKRPIMDIYLNQAAFASLF